MRQASVSRDMQAIIASADSQDVLEAWQSLSGAQRSALLLVRGFPGSSIIHDFDDEPEHPL